MALIIRRFTINNFNYLPFVNLIIKSFEISLRVFLVITFTTTDDKLSFYVYFIQIGFLEKIVT